MFWLYISKIYAKIYGYIKDNFRINIRGFGFLMSLVNVDAIIKVHKFILFLDHNETQAYGRALCGEWNEPETHIFIKNFSKIHAFDFIEVGGSIGEFLLDTATIANGTCWVFEPNPRCAKILKINLYLNDLTNCYIENSAVGDFNGLVNMHFGKYSPVASILSEDSRVQGFPVKIQTLDSYFHNINLEKELLMLVDVEGYEPFVLDGSKRIIAEKKPTIIFEYNKDSRAHFHITDIYEILGQSYFVYRLRQDGFLDSNIELAYNCVAINNNKLNNYLHLII